MSDTREIANKLGVPSNEMVRVQNLMNEMIKSPRCRRSDGILDKNARHYCTSVKFAKYCGQGYDHRRVGKYVLIFLSSGDSLEFVFFSKHPKMK